MSYQLVLGFHQDLIEIRGRSETLFMPYKSLSLLSFQSETRNPKYVEASFVMTMDNGLSYPFKFVLNDDVDYTAFKLKVLGYAFKLLPEKDREENFYITLEGV